MWLTRQKLGSDAPGMKETSLKPLRLAVPSSCYNKQCSGSPYTHWTESSLPFSLHSFISSNGTVKIWEGIVHDPLKIHYLPLTSHFTGCKSSVTGAKCWILLPVPHRFLGKGKEMPHLGNISVKHFGCARIQDRCLRKLGQEISSRYNFCYEYQ